MSQQDRHLTTEQLSAFLDKQLTGEEQAACSLHLTTCEQCQQAQAKLRQTVALLRAMPQPALPRSFVLPADTVVTSLSMAEETPANTPISITEARARRRSGGQGFLRLVSGLVAVLGILLFISACPTMLPHGGGAASTASSGAAAIPAPRQASNVQTPGKNTYQPHTNAAAQGTSASDQAQMQNAKISATPTATAAARPPSEEPLSSSPSPAPSPFEDILLTLSAPLVRVGLGSLLFIVGILGLSLFRRSRASAG